MLVQAVVDHGRDERPLVRRERWRLLLLLLLLLVFRIFLSYPSAYIQDVMGQHLQMHMRQ